jgi:cell division protein FtsW
VVTSSMPPTGVPMPFISAGGSSLSISMASMGILLNISKHCEIE